MNNEKYVTLSELSNEIGLSRRVLEGIIADNNVPCVITGELSHTTYIDKNKVISLFNGNNIILKDKVESRRKENIRKCREWYNKNRESEIEKTKSRQRKTIYTFGRIDHKNYRGSGNSLKRDYELTDEQLKRRNMKRKYSRRNKLTQHGLIIYYDNSLNDLDSKQYESEYNKEYKRQRRCAVSGHLGRLNPSEHFLIDFDLEQMLKDGATDGHGNKMTKWWDGTIRHWNVNCGIWKE